MDAQFADALADGASAAVAVIAACTINLRLMLYSASLAPYVAKVPLRTRLFMGYLLTDQAYAVSIVRWTKEADVEAGGRRCGHDVTVPILSFIP